MLDREQLAALLADHGQGGALHLVAELGMTADADQISEAEFHSLNDLAFKLENGLLKLIESLEQKQITGDWIDSLIIKESNVAYG